jgi:hypothetical protein
MTMVTFSSGVTVVLRVRFQIALSVFKLSVVSAQPILEYRLR